MYGYKLDILRSLNILYKSKTVIGKLLSSNPDKWLRKWIHWIQI